MTGLKESKLQLLAVFAGLVLGSMMFAHGCTRRGADDHHLHPGGLPVRGKRKRSRPRIHDQEQGGLRGDKQREWRYAAGQRPQALELKPGKYIFQGDKQERALWSGFLSTR